MAQFRVTEWNADRLLARVPQILEEFGPIIAEETQRQISTVKWDWDRATLRFVSLYQRGTAESTSGGGIASPPTTQAGASNTRAFKQASSSRPVGQGRGVLIPPGERDIVDTGTLLKSQSAPLVTSKGGQASLRIEWTAPYSGLILRGGDFGSYVNVNGRIVNPGQRPGRDWISASLQQKPFLPFLIESWNRRAG